MLWLWIYRRMILLNFLDYSEIQHDRIKSSLHLFYLQRKFYFANVVFSMSMKHFASQYQNLIQLIVETKIFKATYCKRSKKEIEIIQ